MTIRRVAGLAELQAFRDRNQHDRLDPYEDATRSSTERVDDLLGRMTLAEKAGQLFHQITRINMGDADAAREATEALITEKSLTHFNVMGTATPLEIANLHNALQRAAATTRLGIPITLSSDPRHAFATNPGASLAAGGFSQWPEPIGLAATRDPALVERFADIARREYLAAGIRVALHPMADLATEPRWARISGTFGEDPALAAELVAAYIRGFQGPALGPDSVACMTKHFPGGGPLKGGEDSHFPYGREQVYPAGRFDDHLIPFEAAFAAGTAQIMPSYGMPVGTGFEEVGFAFNRQVITGLLRQRYGFDGVVCADWGVLTDSDIFGKILPARAWGVEHLSVPERAKKALAAGVDQFGGESCPEVIIGLVERGEVSEERIDASVRRLLRDKFRLGLFDDPYVDMDAAARLAGNEAFRAAGAQAQRASIVLLKNEGSMLPLRERPRFYLEGVEPDIARAFGEVVTEPGDAEVALLRLRAPFEPRDRYPLEAFFHAGDLAFPEHEVARITRLCETVPTVIDIHLDRPAVIPEIAAGCAALLGSFGAGDDAILDIVCGRATPGGKLPFELPSSMAAVRAQHEDAPYDSTDPLFSFGHGLTFD